MNLDVLHDNGLCAGNNGGTIICTWAAILEPGVMATANTTTEYKFLVFIAALTWKLALSRRQIAGNLPLLPACFLIGHSIPPQVCIHGETGKLL